MNVLLVHNFYQQPGGEDQVFAAEGRLLEQRGHAVGRFTMDNDAVNGMGKLELARKTICNKDAARSLRQAIREIGAKVVHFHNTFPLISPAAYYAAHEEGAAVVQTLHNFRLMCVSATFCRKGAVCEDCLGRFAWPGILHACYRGNRAASAVVAAMQAYHRFKGTWRREVDVYIALSEFGRNKFIEGGLPPDKIIVKPNFLDPAPAAGKGEGNYALFVGRLSVEKGIAPMIEAWPKVFAETGTKLKIIGDGPLRPMVEAAAANPSGGLEFLGWVDMRKENYATMGSARALIFPSIWYETQGMTMVESMAAGTPVLASRLGSRSEMIADGRTGFLFDSGNPEDLARKACFLLSGQADRAQMRAAARLEFESRYTADQNYPQLMKCYETALARRR